MDVCPNSAMAIFAVFVLDGVVGWSVASMKLVAASFSIGNRFGFDLLHLLWLPSVQ